MFKLRPLIAIFLLSVPLIALAGNGHGGSGDKSGDNTIESRFTALEARVQELETLLAGVSREVGSDTKVDTLVFSGLNVQIVNGMGDTQKTNGSGNLIIGYNELRGDGSDDRNGSHMLIVGIRNNYTRQSYGGIAAGYSNETAGPYAAVAGGSNNLASGWAAAVVGGNLNLAVGNYAVVNGGNSNAADGDYSTINGGNLNVANGFYALVSGGIGNTASGFGAAVSGGNLNTASWYYSSVSGGNMNKASGYAASVSGGNAKKASSSYCWVAGNEVDC